MNYKYLFIAAVSAILLSSCAREMVETDGLEGFNTPETKVVALSENYDDGSFLIKFDSVPDAETLEALEAKGLSLQPLFHHDPANTELESQFGLDRWYEAAVPDGESSISIAREVAALGEVTMVELNSVAEKDATGSAVAATAPTKSAASTFNDPYLSLQWHYNNTGNGQMAKNVVAGADVNCVPVWETLGCAGDPEIIVAVVDEGVKYSHPDLAANMWTNSKEVPGNGIDDDGNGYVDDIHGYNFVDNGDISWTKSGDSGHGTFCAGTVAAVNNNGIGVCGVAGGSGKNDGCRIMSCQIFSGNAGGSGSITSKAIKYAADNGASVISCSFGYTSAMTSDNAYLRSVGSAEIDAIHYFEAKTGNNSVLNGNIAVFSSGNNAHDYAHYPGAFYDIISVSAFGPDMLPTNYTNYGPGCNISAPGGEIGLTDTFKSMVLSTMPSELDGTHTVDCTNAKADYGYMQGTSMACPHVSGVVALALSYAKKIGKTFDRDEFKKMILASTNDMDVKISKTPSKSYVKVSIVGTNSYYPASKDLTLSPYVHMMGTGAIDAWQLAMHIEGLETLTTKIGETCWLDLSDYFGSSSVSLTYLDVEVPDATVSALGLEKLTPTSSAKYPAIPTEGYAYVQFGRLYMHATKVGSGKVTIHAVGGGDHLGGGNNAPGGMEIVQEVPVIAREVKSDNGGWL